VRGVISAWLVVAIAFTAGCAQPGRSATHRYFVTDRRINVGVGPGLCIAFDPGDRHGIWWWEPGASGCTSRSTGPDLFHPADAMVSQSNDSTTLTFRLGTVSADRPFVDVRLVVTGNTMRMPESGAEVSVHRVVKLDVPEMAPRE
jgi:hypothetical protein